ncbi:MAG: YkgJ family cysteine cluster protein [Candidatus Gastranaerophilales bacterium]|nr:YkgJ family cysteine cluster protein [Candidatus Gastranaerophilales bacterium]
MIKIKNIKTYLTTPSKCFIPKCKAKCCINAPLPEDFLPKHKDKIQRQVFGGFNMGVNDIRDKYDSIIYSTRPVIFMGYDVEGNMLATINPEVMKQLQLKTMDDINNLLNEYEAKKIYNYCPFIQDNARCSVYSDRPPICREFGTAPGKINKCPEKATPLEVWKAKIQNFLEIQKDVFKTMWKIISNKETINWK